MNTAAPAPRPTSARRDVLRTTFRALPKIELHRHLEGSLRLSSLAEIATTYDLDVPARTTEALRPFVQMMPDSPYTMDHFLSKFAVLRRFYCEPEVISRIAREAVEDAAADGVRYMELRFTPKALSRLRGFAFADVIRWVCDAVETAQRGRDIRVQLIVAVNRHESLAEAEQQIQASIDQRDRGIVGVDLCGQEPGFPANPFAGLFREAAQAGMGVTIHAGEWAGPSNVRYAIESLGATRIGHGVRIVEDPSVVDLAREAGTVFEVCPTSNWQTGVVASLAGHALPAMEMAGLRTTVNTDDPSICDTTMSDELAIAVDGLGLDSLYVRRVILTAAESAFLPDAERAELVDRFARTLDGMGMRRAQSGRAERGA
jgi:adenosine deaminase